MQIMSGSSAQKLLDTVNCFSYRIASIEFIIYWSYHPQSRRTVGLLANRYSKDRVELHDPVIAKLIEHRSLLAQLILLRWLRRLRLLRSLKVICLPVRMPLTMWQQELATMVLEASQARHRLLVLAHMIQPQ